MWLNSRKSSSCLFTKAVNSCPKFVGIIAKGSVNSWTVKEESLSSLTLPEHFQSLSRSMTKYNSVSFRNSFCVYRPCMHVIDNNKITDNIIYCVILTLITYGLNFQKNQVVCRLRLLLHQTIHRCRLSSTAHCDTTPHVLQTDSVLQSGVWYSHCML